MSALPRVRAVLIDLGGVVVRDPRPFVVGELTRLGSPDPVALKRLYYRESLRLDAGRIGLRQFHSRVRRAGLTAIDYPRFRSIVSDRSLTAFAPVLRELHRAKRQGTVRIVLASNVSRAVWNGLLRKFPLVPFADDAVLSFRVGVLKPRRAFFLEALRKANARPGEVAFLDDSPSNVAAARRLGILAYRVRSAQETVRILRRLRRGGSPRRESRSSPRRRSDEGGAVSHRGRAATGSGPSRRVVSQGSVAALRRIRPGDRSPERPGRGSKPLYRDSDGGDAARDHLGGWHVGGGLPGVGPRARELSGHPEPWSNPFPGPGASWGRSFPLHGD